MQTALVERGRDPSIDFSPHIQSMVRRGWATFFPVLVAIADDPSIGTDPARLQAMTRRQVHGSLDGERLYYTSAEARAAWRRVESAVEFGVTRYQAGEELEPGLFRLLVLLSDPVMARQWAQLGAYPSPEPECGRRG